VKLVIKTETLQELQVSAVYMTYKAKKDLNVVWLACFRAEKDAIEFVDRASQG
jgi:hypothetical protein